MNPNSQDTYTQAYNRWVKDQSPENMAELVSAFMPTVNSELQQYSGSRDLMRSRAKAFVVQAIRSYDPLGKARLSSWVVTNLKQLSRYSKRMRPIRASEEALRNAAELSRTAKELEDTLGRKPTDEELQDETGWSVKTIARLRDSAIPSVTTSDLASDDIGEGRDEPQVSRLDEIPFIRDSVYMSLGDRDRLIFDYRLGAHGKPRLQGTEIARRLGVTPAYVSQRGAAIGSAISSMGAR